MQPKRWIENARKVSVLGVDRRERRRLFWLYLRASWCNDRGRPLDTPVMARLSWKGKPFDYLIREKLDFDAVSHIFLDGEYPLVNLGQPKILFDVGSNVGASVIWFKLGFPDVRIVALEPDPRNAEALRRNVAQFGEDVVVIERALYSEDGEKLQFYSSSKGHMSSSLFQRQETDQLVEVTTITLDTVMREQGIDHIDLLKFDIEGGEYEMFNGFSGLGSVNLMVGEVHKDLLPSPLDEFMDLFKEGFELVDGEQSLADEKQRKPVVLLRNKRAEPEYRKAH